MKLLLLAPCLLCAGALASAQAAIKNPPPISTTKVAPATILSIKMLALKRPDPAVKGERIDVFAVVVRNDTDKNFVRAILLGADKYGAPGDWPPVLDATDNLKFVGAKPPVWQVPLEPTKTKTIYFIVRSLPGVLGYCTGVNDAIWNCTNP